MILFLERKRIKKSFKFETTTVATPKFPPGNGRKELIEDPYFKQRPAPEAFVSGAGILFAYTSTVCPVRKK